VTLPPRYRVHFPGAWPRVACTGSRSRPARV